MDKGSQPSGCLSSSSVTIQVPAFVGSFQSRPIPSFIKHRGFFLDNYKSLILTPKTDFFWAVFCFAVRLQSCSILWTFSPPLAEYLTFAWTEIILSICCYFKVTVCCLAGAQNIMSRNPLCSGSNLSTLALKLTCWNHRQGPRLGELQPFEVSHLSFISRSNNSEVPVDIQQSSRTISMLSSVCVGEESLVL